MVVNRYVNHIGRVQNTTVASPVQKEQGGDFGKILQDRLNGQNEVKFSKHAELRMQSRSIRLTQVQKEKLDQAVKRAEDKGVRDSLVIMDNMAFVVNVKNRTVITAANSTDLKENVFSNIDGAVFA